MSAVVSDKNNHLVVIQELGTSGCLLFATFFFSQALGQLIIAIMGKTPPYVQAAIDTIICIFSLALAYINKTAFSHLFATKITEMLRKARKKRVVYDIQEDPDDKV